MRLITKLWTTLLLLCVAGVANAATEYEVDQKFTSVAALEGQAFAIVNEAEGKAIFGSGNQNLGYDLITTAVTGNGNSGYYFKLDASTTEGCYLLRLQTPAGEPYNIWGSPGYLNTGDPDGTHKYSESTANFNGCFILGLGSSQGQDLPNGAAWEVEYTADKGFTLKNKGLGGYFAGKDSAPTGSDPIYWTFCTLKEKAQTDPLAEQKDGLEAAIAKGKLIPSLAYSEETFAAVGTAVSAGETALAADDATAESLTSATTAITDAIAALAFKENYSSLKDATYGAWSAWGADAQLNQKQDPIWALYTSTGQSYGDGSVNNYAELSGFDKLIITVASGSPRILLNRDADGGQWNETEAESHLIDNTKGGWSAKYFTSEDKVYTVDLKQLVTDKGFAHLHAIKSNDNAIVTGLFLYKEATVTPTPVATEVTFDFNASNHAVSASGATDGDITTEEVNTIDGVVMTISPATSGTANRYWGTNNGPQLRMYSGTMTIVAPENRAITKVVINNGKWNAENTFNGVTAIKGEWEGNSTNVVFAVAGNTQMNSVVVTLADKTAETTTYETEPAPEPVHIANTAETAYTVTEAVALIDAGEALSETVFVKGIISKIDKVNVDKEDATKSYITYWISADGTEEGQQFQCYKGKTMEGVAYDDIKVGAEVIVTGTMTKYQNTTYEFNSGNTLVSYKAPVANPEVILTLKGTPGEEVSLTFGVWNEEDTFTVDFGGENNTQTAKVGIDNKGPVKEDGTTAGATKFTGTIGGDGTITVSGINDIWYLITTNGVMPTTFDQPKLMNVVQMTISGAEVESLELPAYKKMTQFYFNNATVNSVDVSKVTGLTNLKMDYTTLSSIDVSKNTELKSISLMGKATAPGALTSIDLSKNTKLESVYLSYNQLTEVKLASDSMVTVNVQNNKLAALDLSNVKIIRDLYVSDNLLTSIDLSMLTGKSSTKPTINVQNNKLTELTVPVTVKTLQAQNNELTSVSLVDVTAQLNLEGNKLTLATIPAQPASMNTANKAKKFTYAPQAALEVPATVTNLDLSAQATVAKGELDPADFTTYLTGATTFSFVTAGGTALVKGTDYKVTAPGKFQFIKAQEEKVHAVMQNDAFPKFTGANAFATTEFTIEPNNAETELMAEAKTLAADAEAVAVGKLIDAIAAAEESCDETDLAAAVEQFKKDNAESSIDYTAKVGTGKDKWTGAGGTVASVTTKTGTNTPLAELYSSSGAGIKMSQKIEGLENGLYRVKVFATSHNARGEDGAALNTTADDVAYVFATSGEVTNKTWITARGVSDWFVEGELTNPYTIEDIEVSNGELTIGLALDKEKQTGWHSIQIYSLESINTAKAAWAIVKAALQKNIDAATDTLATGENGKAELEAAIEVAKAAVASNKLNVDEVVAANNVLEAAIHEFFEANLKIREDIYYVQETMTGKFLSRGAAWGTRAVVDDYGVPVELNYVPDNKYTIKGIDNNSTYGDDGDLYSDGNGDRMRTFIFNETENGYTLTNTNNSKFVAVNYSGADSLGVIANSETASTFKLLSVAEHDAIVAANKKAAEEAVIAQAGYKADDPLTYAEKIDTLTFKTGSNWTYTAVRGNAPATNENGSEVFQGTGNFVQNVEGLEAGLYKVTIQAMYRDGGNAEVAKLYDAGYNLSHAYLDANGSRVQVKSWGADRKDNGNPNSMGEFAALAKEGKYVSEGFAAVAEDGKLNLTVAVPSYIGTGWFIANQVTYQKVTVDSTAIRRAELQAAITKAEAADTINKTQESIDALKAAIEAAKVLVAKEEITAEEFAASKSAIEAAVAGLTFKAFELAENTIYGWDSGMEGGGKAVASDGQSVTYPTAGYTTIRLNGAKDFSTNVITITLDNAVNYGDTISVTAFRNKNAANKKSGFKAKFENGDKVVSTSTGLEFVNIDTSDASAEDSNRGTEPNTCKFIVPKEAAGSKVITLTRAETGTNLFITKLVIDEKIVDPAIIAAKAALQTIIDGDKTIATEGMQGAEALATAISDAETVVNDDDATIESIAAARVALAKAVATFTKANLGEEFAEIPQNQGKDLDNFTRAELVEGEDYNTYTANADLTIAIKMMNLDVKNCDYLVVKFAEPVAAGWNLAFWSGQDLTGVAAGATEFKYVFAEDPKCDIENGVLPQICMMTFFGGFQAPLEAKIIGIYKHFTDEYMTSINAVKTQRENGEFYNLNGQKVNKAQKGLYIINGKKVVVK